MAKLKAERDAAKAQASAAAKELASLAAALKAAQKETERARLEMDKVSAEMMRQVRRLSESWWHTP